MVDPTQRGPPPWGESVQKALDRRLDGIDSGRYREENERVLSAFARWLAVERDVTDLEEITTTDCRRFAQYLRARVRDNSASPNASADEQGADGAATYPDPNTGQSAERYYAYVRAWLGWCVLDERLDRNPAKPNKATDPLPEPKATGDQQFWTERDRKAITATTDQLVDESFDSDDIDTTKAYRDRALVYVLAYSGCRGAEIFSVPNDERRMGLRWRDVDLKRGLLDVLGKSRDQDEPPAPLLSPAQHPLQRWREHCEPDPADPVFPRLDRAAGDDPDAITTESARRMLRDLCEWADYKFAEPLLPHGARRGLGSDLYEESAELAQETLRHQSIETTHEAYREEQQASVREAAEDALFD